MATVAKVTVAPTEVVAAVAKIVDGASKLMAAVFKRMDMAFILVMATGFRVLVSCANAIVPCCYLGAS